MHMHLRSEAHVLYMSHDYYIYMSLLPAHCLLVTNRIVVILYAPSKQNSTQIIIDIQVMSQM